MGDLLAEVYGRGISSAKEHTHALTLTRYILPREQRRESGSGEAEGAGKRRERALGHVHGHSTTVGRTMLLALIER